MNSEKISEILQLIKNDVAQENHLFKKLANSNNPFPLLKPLKDAGYFDPSKNPKPIEVENQKGYFSIPHWNSLDYLENVVRTNAKSNKVEITQLLIEIVDEFIEFQSNKDTHIDNYRTNWMFSRVIFLLPLEYIHDKYFEFLRSIFKTQWNDLLSSSEICERIVSRLIQNNANNLLLKILDIVLDFKILETERTDKFSSLVDSYWLNEMLRQHKKEILNLCGMEACHLALQKISSIIEKDASQFNIVWIPTIENHSQTTFPDRYECQLVYFVRDCLESTFTIDIEEVIKDLYQREHPIFHRIALHVTNYHYSKLNQYFWNWKENPLTTFSTKHEIYELMKNNSQNMSSYQIDQIIKWIELKDYPVSNDFIERGGDPVKAIAYRKKEWLSAIIDSNNPKANALFEKYNEINPINVEHPGFDIWSESHSGFVSPKKTTELENMSHIEIAQFLKNFKPSNDWNGPSIDGLGADLKSFVLKKTDEFVNEIETYLNVPRAYQYYILYALNDAWKANKTFNWEILLNFVEKIISDNLFWDEHYNTNSYNYRNWIIGQISDLITNGTTNDSQAFDLDLIPRAEDILIILLEKSESNFEEILDVVTSVLNSNRGKIFVALLNCARREARVNKSSKNRRWNEKIKHVFNTRLDKNKEPSIDLKVVIGEYLPNFYHLDKEWVIENINNIFPKDEPNYWVPAITGYFFYSSTIYSDLYKLLIQHGHYHKALDFQFNDNHINEKVVQHICVAYLEDWEKLEDPNSLITRLFDKFEHKSIMALINFFWMQRSNIKNKASSKIIPIWKEITTKCNQQDNNDQIIIAETVKLFSTVESIDDQIFEWLLLAAENIKRSYNTTELIKNLKVYSKSNSEYISSIYLKMLEHDHYPDYPNEDIIEIITNICDSGAKIKAIQICNLYLQKGYDFVRPTLTKIRNE